MSDAVTAAPEHKETWVTKVGLWLLSKVVEQKILPVAIVWFVASGGALRVWLHQKNIPLYVLVAFVVILIPASFGVVTFVKLWRTRLNFHVTVDPVKSVACYANWGGPCIQVSLSATFANASDYDLLLMYAYIKGSRPLMHFEQPILVEAHSAQQERILFFCTKKAPITTQYEPEIVFVDAGGRKKSQRLLMMGVTTPLPEAPEVPEVPAKG